MLTRAYRCGKILKNDTFGTGITKRNMVKRTPLNNGYRKIFGLWWGNYERSVFQKIVKVPEKKSITIERCKGIEYALGWRLRSLHRLVDHNQTANTQCSSKWAEKQKSQGEKKRNKHKKLTQKTIKSFPIRQLNIFLTLLSTQLAVTPHEIVTKTEEP